MSLLGVENMFEIMVFILINAFWVTLILGTLTLFSLRVVYTTQYKYTYKERFMIWFIPLSIGFYLLEKERNKISKIYRISVVIFFITAVLASFYILFSELELMIV